MSYAFFNKFFIAGIPSLHLASIILSKVPHTQPFFFSQQADSTGYDEVLHESNKDIKELTAKQDDPWGQVSTFDIIIHPHLSPPPSRGRKFVAHSHPQPSPKGEGKTEIASLVLAMTSKDSQASLSTTTLLSPTILYSLCNR